VADPDVAEAMARSFLGKLPLDLVDELLAEGERTDYPAGTTIYGRVQRHGRCSSSKGCCAST